MKEETLAFLNAFEVVFDRDWKYSKAMMGIKDLSKEELALDKKLGLETIELITTDGTFLNPKVEDKSENWGNRGALLRAYWQLKESLREKD